ncbi:histidine kinase N-terminal 7TM domain-containing protein [Haloarculaceae archaeon H-GB11]|nr:histidine kinase N-terminal 7TM domain-containing protein [Haloarculaceae archaeon H-GB11]
MSALISIALAGVSWQHRDVPAALPFGLLSLTMAGWSLFDAAFHLSRDPAVALSLYRLSGILAVQVPAIWVVFAVIYVGKREYLTLRRIAAIWLLPVAYVVLTLTEPSHSLMPDSVVFVTASGITAPVVDTPIGFWAVEFASFGYVLVGYIVLGRQLGTARTVTRRQTTLIIMGSLFPFLSNAFYVAGVRVHPGIDLTPIAFSLNGILIAWALFKYDFLNVAPLASDVLIDELPDPVLVLDAEDCIVDHNPAAAALTEREVLSGEDVDSVLPGVLDRTDVDGDATVSGFRGTISGAFDPQVTQIRDQHGIGHGRLLVLRDVSVQQRQLERLEALQSTTQQFIQAHTEAEVARAATDFADRVLEQDLAVVFTYDDETERLDPMSLTDSASNAVDRETLGIDSDSGGVLWEAFTDDEMGVYDVTDQPLECSLDDLPLSNVLLVPLGDMGLLCIGSLGAPEAYTAEATQFAQILARTTETALSRVARERQLRESRETVRRRTEQIEFFNGVLRHNIRNGMLVIDGNVGYLRDVVDPDQQSNLDTISSWCEDLTEMTDKIRSFNETVTADEDERLTKVDLSTLVRDRTAAIRQTNEKLTIDLDVDDGIAVEANELLSEVIESIIRNAVEHNDTDDPTIHIRTVEVGDWIQLRIADDGPGISDDLKESVFERDVATSQTAHGFGLYFVSVMMDLYDGNVWFEDNDPEGAVAVLEFERASATQLAEN